MLYKTLVISIFRESGQLLLAPLPYYNIKFKKFEFRDLSLIFKYTVNSCIARAIALILEKILQQVVKQKYIECVMYLNFVISIMYYSLPVSIDFHSPD